ncbi:hypothetical protein BD779DRAFT_1518385 [Infundibulicybe gibba]|nr:hypothetical protein BD779DRAFT_1518385 [Infundibulicybe gibba]
MEVDSPNSKTASVETSPDANNSERGKTDELRGIKQAGGGENEDEEGDDDDEWDEEEDDSDDGSWIIDNDPEYVFRNIKRTLKGLEREIGTTEGLLRDNVYVANCDALFEDVDDPRTVDIVSRVHSFTSAKCIDVHFSYHYRDSYPAIESVYSLGYKISQLPAGAPRIDLGELRHRFVDERYDMPGWCSIVYGFHDDRNTWYWGGHVLSFDMDLDGVINVHEALWGPLADLPPDASADDQVKQRQALIRALRVLLASVGIEYEIACQDGQDDFEPSSHGGQGGIAWMLGSHRFARSARKACGFELARDPEEERKAQERGE